MVAKILGAQRDFSAGEIDVSLKRADDHPARKTGLRQMANARILNSGAVQERSGRSSLFPALTSARCEKVSLNGTIFTLAFGASGGTGEILIKDATGVQQSRFFRTITAVLFPWTIAQVSQIRFAVVGLSIYLTFPSSFGLVPQVLTWDGVNPNGWLISDYAEALVGNQKRTPFYRIAPKGITIAPSASSGSSVTVIASVPYFTAAHIGTRIRYINRQILITNVPAPYPSLSCGATVEEVLPGSQNLTCPSPESLFAVGDVVRGSVTGSVGQVASINPGVGLTVQLLNTTSTTVAALSQFSLGGAGGTLAFTTSDILIGPGGSAQVASAAVIGAPTPTTIWDEEVMNPMRGYPQSVFADQFRLGFCDFPSLPRGIAWSSINNPTDLYVGADPSSAMFELAPDNVRIFDVVAGPESSEFVFCDKKVYYIKIDATNPLKPGSVGFQTLSGDGAAHVQPRVSQELIFYVNAGGNSVIAIEAPGAYYRPFNTRNLSEFSAHLFNNIQALAIPNADGSFNERYIYCLNGNNQLVVGKFTIESGQMKGLVGWGPWTTNSSVLWVSALNADVLFTTTYFNATICEALDDTRYLDASVFVNALPAPFTPPAGQGPLWWLANQTVTLMDQATRPMGTYQVDAHGNIVPQNNGGENLAVASLVAGQQWTLTIEPFCPDASPGQAVGQRMFARRVSRFAAHVVHSTGFMMARLFSGPLTPTSPALGTVMNFTRFPTFNQDDDATKPPPQREIAERTRPLGRSFDPRVAIIKDTPGPLTVLEIGLEATI